MFVWNMCGKEIIRNLLERHHGIIHAPIIDKDGDIVFRGNNYTMTDINLEKELETETNDRLNNE